MARPRKYFTAEDLRLSKCRKSKKWYDSTALSPSNSDYWLSCLEDVTVKLNQWLNHTGPKQYVEALYDNYINDRTTQPIDDALASLNEFRESIDRCFKAILQLSGVGEKLGKVETKLNEVSGVIRAVEEILCYAMGESHETLIDSHARRALLFQSLA
ncbi:hypothetical protein H0H93_010408 [Arthromyces matolae]|nr:hypothetical protein H0H93_010408 [Arthromyces matolae]